MRVLALDLGEKRIGLAVSDPTGAIATPAGALMRGPSRADDHDRVAAKVDEVRAEAVVVGLPRSLSGRLGPKARQALEEVDQLRNVLDVPVHTYDERFSTVVADRALRQGRGRSVGGAGRRRGDLDAAAAAVLLQGWLDGQRGMTR